MVSCKENKADSFRSKKNWAFSEHFQTQHYSPSSQNGLQKFKAWQEKFEKKKKKKVQRKWCPLRRVSNTTPVS